MNPRPDLPAPGPDGSISEQLVGYWKLGTLPPPPRARWPPSPQAGGAALVRTAGCREAPPCARRRLQGPCAPRWGPGWGAAPCPSSRLCGNSRLLPSRRAAWRTRAALRRLGLSSVLQQGVVGESAARQGVVVPPPLAGTTMPCQPSVPGLPTRLSPSLPGWAKRPSASSRRREGRKGRSSSQKGPGVASGCGLREAAEAQWPGGGTPARCPSPTECPPGVRAPPGPAPATPTQARGPGPCWPGRRHTITPAGSVPGRPTSPPTRMETGVGDFTEGIYCSELKLLTVI